MVVSVPSSRPKRTGLLRFSRETDVMSGGFLEMVNDGGMVGESVNFKVQSTCASDVTVAPIKGVIPPGGSAKLTVYTAEDFPGNARIKVIHSLAGETEVWKNVFAVRKEPSNSITPPTPPESGHFTIQLNFNNIINKSDTPHDSINVRAKRLEVEATSIPFPAPCGKSSLRTTVKPVTLHRNPGFAMPGGSGKKCLLYLTAHDSKTGAVLGQPVKLDATQFSEQEKKGELSFGSGISIEVSMKMFPAVMNSNAASTRTAPTRPNPIESGLVKQQQRINVCLRLKPLLGSGPSNWVVNSEANVMRHGSEPNKLYVFDSIIPEQASNADVYEMTKLKHLLARYISGVNCTVFAYGQTSSGKTHTMYGGSKTDGLIPRSITDLFMLLGDLAAQQHTGVDLKATYFEIYNEDIFDLLDSCKPVQLRETEAGLFTPLGLREQSVHTAADCLSLLKQGSENRSVGFSNLNDRSSRSHTVFRLSLLVRDSAKKTVRKSQFNLVDLAGSESLLETIDITQKRETTKINLSLSYLKKVITELSRNTPHIVYRNSSLTKVLKQSLGGNSLTTVICTVTRAEDHRKETKSTLLFGMTAKTIKNKVKVNEVGSRVPDQKLLQEIEYLKKQLAVTEDELTEARAAVKVLTKEKEQEKTIEEEEPEPNVQAPDVTDEATDAITKDIKMKDLIQDVLDYLYYGSPVYVAHSMETAMLYLTDTALCMCCIDENDVPSKRQVVDSVPLDGLDIVLLGNDDSGRGISFVASELKQTIDIVCKTSTDKEAWMLAITQVTACELHWATLLDISQANGAADLLPAEIDLCQTTHILPCDYLNAKGQILSTGFNFLTIYDIRTLTSLDLYRSTALLNFFIKQNWLTRHELLRVNHEFIQDQ